MKRSLPHSQAGLQFDTKMLSVYLIASALLGIGALSYTLPNLNIRYTALALGLPLGFLVATHPRLALYQFVFVLFVEHLVLPSVPLLLVDVSAALLILAGVLDVLLSDRLPGNLPRMTGNYLFIITALVLAGLFGYWPHLAIRPVVRVTLLFVTFLSVYRLTKKTQISELVHWLFALAVLHSLYVLVQFVASGGEYRAFGFTRVAFDDQAMVVLPIGIALYLWSSGKKAWYYLAGSATVLGALIATQSRASILFALAASVFVLVVSHRGALRLSRESMFHRLVPRRAKMVVGAALMLMVVMAVFESELLATVIGRFERLFSLRPSGTVLYRIALWKRALMTFVDYPILGVGPGGFKNLHELYSTLHLTPVYYLTHWLSAHNLLLHYLAEAGIVGGLGLVALLVNQFRLARQHWLRPQQGSHGLAMALYGWAFLFALTTMLEAGWMWGQVSFMAVFLAALIARQCDGNTSHRSA